MHDQEVDSAGLATAADSVQAPALPSPAPTAGRGSFDEEIARIEAALISKENPVPLRIAHSNWLVTGYLRTTIDIEFVAWQLGAERHEDGTWPLTGETITQKINAYEQLTMEDLNDVK